MLCEIADIARSSYYKWSRRQSSAVETVDIRMAQVIRKIHDEDPSKGYRRIKDELYRSYGITANDKKVLRICRILKIRSGIKYRCSGCTINGSDPAHIAENILSRDFTAEHPDQKWVTDVTEFKYYIDGEKHKLYLSAILDLYDHRIVAYEIGDRNDKKLVFENFDHAVRLYPDAHPVFHSDRGFQYTSAGFHQKLMDAGMTQSMSRVGKCTDNGAMEGFWGILKRERYYGVRFTSKEELAEMITSYIEYYNNRRYQRGLGVLTPMERYEQYYTIAA